MRTRVQDLGLLVLRLGVGGVLVAHGGQKLFGWFGGHGIAGTAGAFEQMGFRPGRASAVAAGLTEAGGGALIGFGLATPAAGAAAAGTMLTATSVHAPAGFFAAGGGYEYPALLGVSTAALALTGPGRWSLDTLLQDRLNRPWMALVGLLGSGAASAAIVLRRRQQLTAEKRSVDQPAPADSPQTPAAAPTPDASSEKREILLDQGQRVAPPS
jgi:putative oxidoreductase